MWYVITFLVGMLFGGAAVVCSACLAVAKTADEEEREMLKDYGTFNIDGKD